MLETTDTVGTQAEPAQSPGVTGWQERHMQQIKGEHEAEVAGSCTWY